MCLHSAYEVGGVVHSRDLSAVAPRVPERVPAAVPAPPAPGVPVVGRPR